jgi:DNA-binding response OmpR family regulator
MQGNGVDKNIELTIVIVDDSPDDHFFIKEALSEFKNIAFRDYYNGEDFLRYLEDRLDNPPHKHIYPNILILDINMPRLTGFEVIELAKKKDLKDSLRFYILTTSLTEPDQGKCRALNIRCFMKPFNIDHFTELLEAMIRDCTENNG